MPEVIKAWVYNPTRALFGKKSSRAARYEVTCENPSDCDLFVVEKSCLLTGSCSGCKFGTKARKDGPTQRAKSFYGWISDEQDYCKSIDRGVIALKAYNRIFKTNGYYYLPYAGMSDAIFLDGAPLRSEWVPEEAMDSEQLARLCNAQPRNVWGEVVRRYQSHEVVKFLADIKIYYPDLFALLPDDQKARVETIDYVGRKADLTTLAPGPIEISKVDWQWDGVTLSRKGDILLQPVPGEATQTITPTPGAAVTITRNDQVTDKTVLLD
ncbi:hypothetical protein LCGC14_0228750 [marine sediment metagenome]|jgi:hypothetical protein|uniref:Uncharacterized protein n=1 Tax=marine sediment metagenome TaxID=412755 RepID=A0A0F9WVT4_9ZZZZ